MIIKNILKNIKYLSRHRLQNEVKNSIDINNYIDSIKYELDSLPEKPKIMAIDDTIDDLIKNKKSICRFGDGELRLIEGNNIPFQKASVELSERLKEVLSSNHNDIAIAIPRVLYSDLSNVVTVGKDFWRSNGNNFRSIIEQYISFDNQYYAAECTLAYTMYCEYNCEAYFNKIRKIWEDRKVTIIHGKGIFQKIKHNIFDNTGSRYYIELDGNRNAFDEYKDLLSSFTKKDVNKSTLVIAILGPTATVLCYDLSMLGYQALDLGHIVKSYDYFVSNKTAKTMDELVEFFKD